MHCTRVGLWADVLGQISKHEINRPCLCISEICEVGLIWCNHKCHNNLLSSTIRVIWHRRMLSDILCFLKEGIWGIDFAMDTLRLIGEGWRVEEVKWHNGSTAQSPDGTWKLTEVSLNWLRNEFAEIVLLRCWFSLFASNATRSSVQKFRARMTLCMSLLTSPSDFSELPLLSHFIILWIVAFR